MRKIEMNLADLNTQLLPPSQTSYGETSCKRYLFRKYLADYYKQAGCYPGWEWLRKYSANARYHAHLLCN